MTRIGPFMAPLVFAALAACASSPSLPPETTPEGFRARLDASVIVSRMEYVEVFRLLNAKVRACLDHPNRHIQSALYRHQTRGAIAISAPANAARPYILLVELIPNDGGTEIVVYARSVEIIDQIHDWLLGQEQCSR